MTSAGQDEALRRLPSVDELLRTPRLVELAAQIGRGPVVRAVRAELEERRSEILAGADGAAPDLAALAGEAARRAAAAGRQWLGPVINATGVVLHTNLGRAPLAEAAREAVSRIAAGYSNLEFDIESGARGSRQSHVASAFCELTGAEAAHVVNNNAAAVLLALAALARGREVVISRGQLVEIGGSFRIPEICAQSGARLVEVGTTNRTRLADYERAIGAETAALVRVHQSNFRTVGFTEDVEIEDLCALAANRGLAVIDDLGSGALADLDLFQDEPSVRRSLDAGADLVCFSGDKLLGGPQAGILVGKREAIDRCARHPLARALRPDKLTLAALAATLGLYGDPEVARREIPVLRMLDADGAELVARAERLRRAIEAACGDRAEVEIVRATGRVGGGALPLVELEGPVCAVSVGPLGADELAARLRSAPTPVIGRISEGRLMLDPRTMSDAESEEAAAAVASAGR